jgi:hypothetical protein
MEQLIKALPAVLRAADDSPEVATAACTAAWNHAVGDGLRENALPIGFEENTLIVVVADHIWQRQLQTMLGPIMYRLNSVLGRRLITNIELRVDPNAIATLKMSQTTGRGKAAGKQADNVSPELRFAAGSISDPQLRKAFLGAAESCLDRLEKQ